MKNLFLLILILFSFSNIKSQIRISSGVAAASGALSRQAKSYGSSSNITTHSMTLDYTPTQGNLMLLAVDANSTANTPSGWTLASSSVNQGACYLFYKIAGAGESTSISVTLTSAGSATMCYAEASGRAGTVDKTATSANFNGTSGGAGPTATTTQSNELLVAVLGIWEGTGHTYGPITGWDNSFIEVTQAASTVSNAREVLGIALRPVYATGAYQFTATWTTVSVNTTDAIICAFK